MQIPEKLANFAVYVGAQSQILVGVATATLPKFESETETVGGAGIAGSYEAPTIGNFKSMMLGLKFRIFTPQSGLLLAPGQLVVSLYNSVQVQDPALGLLTTSPWRVDVRGQVKSLDLGKLEPGKVTDQQLDVEVAKLVISYADVEVVQLDKLNNVFRVNGKDFLASVRSDLGGV